MKLHTRVAALLPAGAVSQALLGRPLRETPSVPLHLSATHEWSHVPGDGGNRLR